MSGTQQTSKELNVAHEAANQAAQIIREYDRKRGELNIQLKGHNDLLTDADLNAEEKILEVIRNHFPKDQILAEETANKAVLPEGRVWIIDPIDGTTNFAHGFPVYCVSIAFWEDGKPKAALVLEVNRNEYFAAEAGKGASLNGRQIQVSGITSHDQSLLGTGFPYNDFSMVQPYLDIFDHLMKETHGLRRPGSAAYDLCTVACGRLDGFYEYSLSPWDVAAGALIIREAGGVVTDWDGEDNWLFGERIIAGNASITEYLQNVIAEYVDPEKRKALHL